ncbi:MAG: hypothetical protein H0U76_01525 [Ktedonobacteraceae bacterium]|nr:hypothetical protein [Ktedonobacteraceae bacterium]
MEPGPKAELPSTAYHLAERYRVGQPLALYTMHPWWVRFCAVCRQILLGVVICAVLFVLVVVALFLFQYLIGVFDQGDELQSRLTFGLPGIIIGLMGCVEAMVMRSMIGQKVPISLLLCTEGLLAIHPKKVEVTHWNEVRGDLQGPGFGKKKRYTLQRLNRKPLLLNEAFEDLEGLVDLVRQLLLEKRERASSRSVSREDTSGRVSF